MNDKEVGRAPLASSVANGRVGRAAEELVARRAALQVVLIAALVASVCGALYLIGLIGKLLVDGSVRSISSPGVQVISAAVGLLWDTALVVLFVAWRRVVRSRKLAAELALAFILLMCATSSVNWFIQLAFAPSVAGDVPDVQYALTIPYAMEHLGWGLFYGLASLFAAWAASDVSPEQRGGGTGKGRMGAWMRWLFIVGGILGLLHFAGMVLGSTPLADVGYIAWGVLLPATTILMAASARQDLKNHAM